MPQDGRQGSLEFERFIGLLIGPCGELMLASAYNRAWILSALGGCGLVVGLLHARRVNRKGTAVDGP